MLAILAVGRIVQPFAAAWRAGEADARGDNPHSSMMDSMASTSTTRRHCVNFFPD